MFIRVEDMRRYQNNAQPAPARTETKRTNKEPIPRDHNRPSERRPAKFSNYGPLNAPRSCILDEVLQAELLPPPRKYQNPPNADLSKYCHYTATMATPPTNATPYETRSKNSSELET